MSNSVNAERKKHSLSRTKQKIIMSVLTIFAAAAAIVFLLPTVLTIANSFMSASEINANYGAVFAKTEEGSKVYVSEKIYS